MKNETWLGNKVVSIFTMDDLHRSFKKILDDRNKKVCLDCNGNGVKIDYDTMSLKHCNECKGTGLCATTVV